MLPKHPRPNRIPKKKLPMNEETVFEATEAENGIRQDACLAEWLEDYSRSAVQKLIEEGNVLVNGKPEAKNYKLHIGDEVQVTFPAPELPDILPEAIPLDIVYEDSDLLVVNKPKGMVVHPAPGNYTGTLVNALLSHCRDSLSGINGVIRPGIVHRIDKNTSGLLIVAKNDKAHQGLAVQIKEHSFLREYEAVVYGRLKQEEGTVSLPIGRSRIDRKKMTTVNPSAPRDAVTHYRVLEQYEQFAHIRCRLETGRTHQIRVHMAALGHPVAGDEVYGPKKVIHSLEGQCLHAKTIGFVHPTTGEWLAFDSPLPEYFQSFLRSIR